MGTDTVTSPTQAERRVFKTRACEVFGWPPEQFSHRLFWLCLHRRALPLAKLILLIRPSFFTLDFALLDEVAAISDTSELVQAINSFRDDCRMRYHFCHETLRLRISGRRLMAFYGRVNHRRSAHRH